ncbi:MAG: T9SS type A sorting domain-containing protein [Candidatus Cloacimonetes bacterium]|nr:T9SS type A sorting domain-containing protein [Candidatus Cloacimonadota bacterium]
MKRAVIIIFITLLSYLIQAKQMTYSFGVDTYDFLIEYPREETSYISDIGAPRLPCQEINLLIPYGYNVESIKVELSHFSVTSLLHKIPAVQLPVSLSGSAIEIPPDSDIYAVDRYYPLEDHKYIGYQRLGGYDIAQIVVYPYKYNAVRDQVISSSQIDMEIELGISLDARLQQEKSLSHDPGILNRIRMLVKNEDILMSYPVTKCSQGARLVDPEDPSQLLIICGEEYLDIFEDYALWRESKGIISAVYTIESIISNFTGGADAADNLRDFIIEAYQTWNGTEIPLEFVLLAGDDEIIPYRGCWGTNYYYGAVYNMPSDVYFGNLDGDWDANGNGVYGEYNDDVDLLPELSVGRFPGDNAQEFINQINKIKDYVEYPSEYLDSMLLIGEILNDNPTWGGDLLDDLCDAPENFPQYYQKVKLYDRDDTFSPAAVVEHIDSSQSFMMFHCAHTHYYYLFGINQNQMDNFQNSCYPYFFCGGCFNIAFDQETSGNAESVGEHAVNDDNGMMGFLGNSRYGFSTYLDYLKIMFNAIYFQNVSSFGHGLTAARDYYSIQANINDIVRYQYFEMTNCCDPSLDLITGDGLYPSIFLDEYTLAEVEGNSNGQIDPGELIEIIVTGNLAEDYNCVADLTLELLPEPEQYDIIAGESIFGAIVNGDSFCNSQQPFIIMISDDFNAENLEIRIDVSANHGFDFFYKKKFFTTTGLITDLNENNVIIKSVKLEQNYPNPFNPDTTINFQLPETGYTELNIYDLKGRLVKCLIKGQLSEGKHSITIDGSPDTGNDLVSGVYFLRLISAGQSSVRRMVLLK